MGVLVGLWPRSVSVFGVAVCFVSPLAKRKSGWGICGSSLLVCCFFVLACWFDRFAGGELDDEWDVLLACTKEAHVYGPSLSKQDDWNARAGTIAGTAHTQEYLLLHIAMFPIGAHTWCRVLGVPHADQVQAQIISRAMKLLRFCPITPAHRKPPWPGYTHGLRLFTKLLVAHPLVGVCLPPEIRPADYLRLTGYMVGSLYIRGHSAGSYAGMVWETILTEFPDIEGKSHCSATIATDSTPAVPAPTGTPDSPCRGPALRMEPIAPRHETAPATRFCHHTHHRMESIPRHCTTQLFALDTSCPSRGTTGHGTVRGYSRSASL